jgi:hypothetical protein
MGTTMTILLNTNQSPVDIVVQRGTCPLAGKRRGTVGPLVSPGARISRGREENPSAFAPTPGFPKMARDLLLFRRYVPLLRRGARRMR